MGVIPGGGAAQRTSTSFASCHGSSYLAARRTYKQSWNHLQVQVGLITVTFSLGASLTGRAVILWSSGSLLSSHRDWHRDGNSGLPVKGHGPVPLPAGDRDTAAVTGTVNIRVITVTGSRSSSDNATRNLQCRSHARTGPVNPTLAWCPLNVHWHGGLARGPGAAGESCHWIQVRWPQGPAAAIAAGQQLELSDLPVNLKVAFTSAKWAVHMLYIQIEMHMHIGAYILHVYSIYLHLHGIYICISMLSKSFFKRDGGLKTL